MYHAALCFTMETVCAQLPLLKASRNSGKFEKKMNPSERRSVQFTKNNKIVVEIGWGGGGTYN